MNAAVSYFEKAIGLLREVREQELGAIEQAADVCASSIARGGLVFLFGNGHSRMLCEEMTPRQGCFPGFVAVVELALSNHADIIGANGLRAPLYLEKYEGYAEEILKGFRFGPHDAFIVISTSGIRPVVVEMAAGAQRRRMPVIGIVARRHCEGSPAAHSSGKKLIDVADIVIDNHCPPGDCVFEVEGLANVHGHRVAVNYSRSNKRAREFARQWSIPESGSDLDEIVGRSDIDLYMIALPNEAHLPVSLQLSRAKKNQVCTKPLGRDRKEAKLMLAAARRSGALHGYAETEVFAPSVVRVRQMIESGSVGRVLWVRSRESHSGPHSPHF